MSAQFCVQGFKEAVFIVSDLTACQSFYCDTIGWEVVHSSYGLADLGLSQLWQLPKTLTYSQVVIREPGSQTGSIRLVQLEQAGIAQKVHQECIRPNDQIWDPGGIFDVNTRVNGAIELAKTLNKHHWFGVCDPVPMSFGPFNVIEWLAKGHDGVKFACIERISPPLENGAQQALFSHLFNASMIVSNHQEAVEFYQNVLNFELVVEQYGCFEEAKANVFGLPKNIVTTSPHQLSMLKSRDQKSEGGTLELASFPELDGVDLSDRATPPNFGIATLRFPVQNLKGFIEHCKKHKVTIVNESELYLPQDGSYQFIAIKAPGGCWLEFYELAEVAAD